jgi:hypothetical protein
MTATPPTRLINPDGSWKRMTTDFPTLDSNGDGLGYGFRLNDSTYGPDSTTSPDKHAAPVLSIDAGTNILYGGDSPRTELGLPANWDGGSWTRTDAFIDTLMYNPDILDDGMPHDPREEVSGGSIWIPVGKITWNWTATAGYFLADPNPHWYTLSNNQDKTGYVATTVFPTWSAYRKEKEFDEWF